VSVALALREPRIEAFLGERGRAPEIEALSGDASTRRYFRLREGASTSVLALYPEPFDAEASPFVAIRALFESYGLPVPRLHDADGPRGILLLEDLGDTTQQQALAAAPGDRDALYAEAVEALARLQQEAARGPRHAPCFEIAFDVEKLAWELHYFVKHFVEGRRGCELSVEDRAALGEAIHALGEEIAGWPRVLCHRDFHSRNLMRHRDVLHWIDFQDARLGPATYDLVSLVRDSYVDLEPEFALDLAEGFRARALPHEPREVFLRRFDLMSAQRNLKALGTFGFMKTQRGTDVYEAYVPRTLAHARRTLAARPELSSLRRVLGRHIEELR
jgi:aminoglycoside/choline kinase family phosphotransferase